MTAKNGPWLSRGTFDPSFRPASLSMQPRALPWRALGSLLCSWQGDFPNSSKVQCKLVSPCTFLSWPLSPFSWQWSPLEEWDLVYKGRAQQRWEFNDHLPSWGTQLAEESPQEVVIANQAVILTSSEGNLSSDWCGPLGQIWEPREMLPGRSACKVPH